MYQNPTQLDSYNKNDCNTHGTLIANWFEEAELRRTQGEPRAVTKTHVPKLHSEIYVEPVKLPENYKEDNTSFRLLGIQGSEKLNGQTESYFYGKGQNKAETFNKIGKKQRLLQQMYLNQVRSELQQKKEKQEQQANKREFQTTNKTTFVKHTNNQNIIGRRVMYDQNGAPVPFENIDEDLKIDKGFYERKQITPDEELKQLLQLGEDYTKQQPVTFWREKLQDGTFYMSKTGSNPNQAFNKNNEFLKTFKEYKHYKD